MNDDEIPPLPPAPEPQPAPQPLPPPETDYSQESAALIQFLADAKAAEDAVRAEQDPELEAVEAACDATRIEQRT